MSLRFSSDLTNAVITFERQFSVADRESGIGSPLGEIITDWDEKAEGAGRSAIGQHRLRFDAGGRLAQRFYEKPGGAPARDAMGAVGRAYAYRDDGLVAELRNIEDEGKTIVERGCVASITYDYDPRSRLARISCVRTSP